MLLNLIEHTCNRAFAHDPNAGPQLEKLEGKVIALEIKGLNQSVLIKPFQQGVELNTLHAEDPSSQEAHVSLAATPAALMKIARHGMENVDLEPGELEINGDPILAQRFSALVSGLDVDWEGVLADHMSEPYAAMVSRGVRTSRAIFEEGSTQLKQKVNELIKNDLSLVAEKEEVEQFLEDVDSLRATVDRLQARLNRLVSS